MKYKSMICIVLVCCLLLTGCQLAKPETTHSTQEDRMIGVLITREYLDLFDAESYFNDHVHEILKGGEISPEEQEQYRGRVYATLQDRILTNEDGEESSHPEFVFEGVEGYYHFVARMGEGDQEYVSTMGDASISSGQVHLSYSDTGEDVTFSGTLYVSTGAGTTTHYINPVYQDAEGNVYATTGNGMSADFNAEGMRHSTTFETTTTYLEDDVTKEYHFHYEIAVEAMTPPTEVRLLQMNEDHEVISQEVYKPDTMPTDLQVSTETAYVIAELVKGDTVTRQLLDRTQDCLTTYRERKDHICEEQMTFLHWPEA